MQAKDLKNPQIPGRGIGMINYGKIAFGSPDIVVKAMDETGQIFELGLFANPKGLGLNELHKARFFGVSIRRAEAAPALPEIQDGEEEKPCQTAM